MAKFILFFVLCLVFCFGNAKHIHPKSIGQMEEDVINDSDPIFTEIDGMSIEMIRNIKPNRFVPVNNVLFFTSYPPCKEGFERDLLGVCREVWD